MSGPIVRKYGFPNFEKIFGERELKHGGGEPESPKNPTATGEAPQTPPNPDPAKGDGEATSKP